MSNDTIYQSALVNHAWCMERNIVARIRYADGQWFCEYTTAREIGWRRF